MRIAQVLVTAPVDKTYDYLIPEGMGLEAGDYVLAPVGPRPVVGVVWSLSDRADVSTAKLKTLLEKYDLPAMTSGARVFLDWVAKYNMAPRGGVLKMAIPVLQGLEPPQPLTGYMLREEYNSPSSHTLPVGDQFSSPQRGEDQGEGGKGYKQKPAVGLRIFSQRLRRNETDVENRLWYLLRNRQIGKKFRRQHPIPPYIVDFVCLEKKLIVELDGGQHAQALQEDCIRDTFLKSHGYSVLRFWNNDVLENEEGVLKTIEAELGKGLLSSSSQFFSPSPPPLPVGEREKGRKLSVEEKGKEIGDHFSSPQRGEDQGEGGKVIAVLSDGLPRRLSELSRSAGVSSSVIKTLLKRQVIVAVDLFAKDPCATPDPDFQKLTLSSEQQQAASALTLCLEQEKFEAFLLDGVTGAGKTEVYFEAVATIIRAGKQALVLLPEIALSNSFIARFKQRFGVAPALWHSSLTPAQRRVTWRGIVTGHTRVVVGARSALFLPYAALGLIVVDEEHDPAFKQEEGICYNARDMAVMRGFQAKIPVVLASATPSLETMQNVWDGRYTYLQLPDRFGGADKPDIKVVDLRVDKPERQHFISPVLREALSKNLEQGQQSLLFLNRRGFAPLTLCRSCGHRMECPRCTAWLVEHKRTGKLQCHHCGFETRLPEKCPSCQDSGSLVACGPGVERVAEEVKDYFPAARLLILASDVTDTHEKLTKALGSIQNGEVDIVIGTQIIAKGHHFPNLTCVGIVDADLGLSGGDLRATERSFQLLHQVAGRAGREALKGTVYLQTYNPEQRVIQMLAEDDRDQFLRAESAERQRAYMPPFSRLAALIISGANEGQTAALARQIGQAAPLVQGIRVLGPAPAQMYRIRGKYRQRLLVQAEKNINLQKMVSEWLGAFKVPSNLRVQVDIDPQNFV